MESSTSSEPETEATTVEQSRSRTPIEIRCYSPFDSKTKTAEKIPPNLQAAPVRSRWASWAWEALSVIVVGIATVGPLAAVYLADRIDDSWEADLWFAVFVIAFERNNRRNTRSVPQRGHFAFLLARLHGARVSATRRCEEAEPGQRRTLFHAVNSELAHVPSGVTSIVLPRPNRAVTRPPTLSAHLTVSVMPVELRSGPVEKAEEGIVNQSFPRGCRARQPWPQASRHLQ